MGSWSVKGVISKAFSKVRSNSFKNDNKNNNSTYDRTPNPGGGAAESQISHSKSIRRQKSAYASTSHRDRIKHELDDDVRKMVTHNDQKLHALQALKTKRLIGD